MAQVIDPVRLEMSGTTYSLSSLGLPRVSNMKVDLASNDLARVVTATGIFTLLVDLVRVQRAPIFVVIQEIDASESSSRLEP